MWKKIGYAVVLFVLCGFVGGVPMLILGAMLAHVGHLSPTTMPWLYVMGLILGLFGCCQFAIRDMCDHEEEVSALKTLLAGLRERIDRLQAGGDRGERS